MKRAVRIDSRRRVALSWMLVVLWAALIFFMSAHTGADLDTGEGIAAQIKRWLAGLAAPIFGEGADVVSPLAHFMEYAVFGALLFVALFQTRRSAETETASRQGTAEESASPKDIAEESAGPNDDNGKLASPGGATGTPASPAPRTLWLLALAAVAIASLYGVTDEFHQSFVPDRACDPVDWLVDTAGAALGAVIARKAIRR